MLERQFKEPYAAENEIQKGLLSGLSVLLLKPETQLLSVSEKTRVVQLLETEFAIIGRPISVFSLLIDKPTATNLWKKDIERYEWAENYYDYMTSAPCVAIVLSGNKSATLLKKKIRIEMAGTITRLREVLRADFDPDIVHGSDPDDGLSELKVFIEATKNI